MSCDSVTPCAQLMSYLLDKIAALTMICRLDTTCQAEDRHLLEVPMKPSGDVQICLEMFVN